MWKAAWRWRCTARGWWTSSGNPTAGGSSAFQTLSFSNGGGVSFTNTNGQVGASVVTTYRASNDAIARAVAKYLRANPSEMSNKQKELLQSKMDLLKELGAKLKDKDGKPFVPKGSWSVEYTVRLNNVGDFALPPTRVEAMYAPEMFGEAPNARVKVEAAK